MIHYFKNPDQEEVQPNRESRSRLPEKDVLTSFLGSW